MKSKIAAKVVTIYSIVVGVLFILSAVLGDNDSSNIFLSIMFGIAFITLGVLGLVYANKLDSHIEKPYIITLFVLYCIFEVLSFLVIAIPLFGLQLFLVLQALFAVPFSFSIVYLVKLSRENDNVIVNSKPINIIDAMDMKPDNTSEFEQKINTLKKLRDEGLISEEEFKELLSKHLHQHI
ncbi:MAG: SHOCT domain-containing protein [Acholeplasmataceae bacterium]|jgi:hypothetical protein|nr:SHOCT domain-containing protein [Acholeplasmataceae bacterium]